MRGTMEKCKQCGKDFRPKWEGHAFCSRECQYESMRGTERPEMRRKSNYTCKHCGQVFEAYADRCTFCSRECFRQWRKESPPNTKARRCEECGAEHSKGAKVRYCSEACEERAKENKIARTLWARLAKEKRDRAEREAKEQAKHTEVECSWCGDMFQSNGTKRVYCSDECKRKADNHRDSMRKDGRRKANGNFDPSITLPKLYLRDGGKCYLCGGTVDMKAHHNSDTYGSIDHVTPTARGGAHTWDNVRLAHRICNSVKADKLIESAT